MTNTTNAPAGDDQHQDELVLVSGSDRTYETAGSPPLEAHDLFGVCEASGTLQQGDQTNPFDLFVDLPWRNITSGCSTTGGLSPAQTLSLVSADLMLSDFARAEL